MHKSITKLYTWQGYAINAFWLAFALFFAFATIAARVYEFHDYNSLLLVVLVPVIIFSSLYISKRSLLSVHRSKLESYAAAMGYPTATAVPPGQNIFAEMSLSDLRNTVNDQIRSVVDGGDWTYAEYSYDVMRRTKYGSYRAATAYYGVMATELPRELPNVFFDSRSSRGRQFRFHFAASQRHSLEGDFDDYFVTYFPEQYTVDSLSFISPDVMWALREAADYDVEIVGNRIYMYGPLSDPPHQLPDMSAKLAAIKSELLDNILTYRDERLPYAQGRQRVAPLGAELKRSKAWTYISIALAVLYFILRILAESN